MREEDLAYFKDIFEGRAEISWNAWFIRHEARLAVELPRMTFLRLKFNKLDAAEKLLHEAGVPIVPDALALRRERYHALLHPSVLDDRGRPLESFRRIAYSGAIGKILDEESEAAKEILAKVIKRIRRYAAHRRADELGDMAFDGEMELTVGHREIGLAILKAVASIPSGDDLCDHATDRARQLLADAVR